MTPLPSITSYQYAHGSENEDHRFKVTHDDPESVTTGGVRSTVNETSLVSLSRMSPCSNTDTLYFHSGSNSPENTQFQLLSVIPVNA